MADLSARLDEGWSTIKAGLRFDGKHPGATLSQRFINGTFWSLIGAVGTQGSTLLASVFTARLLGREAFGQFSFLQGTVMTTATFAGFGLGLTATRYVAHYRQEEPQRTGDFIRFVMTIASAVSALTSLLMVAAAPYLALHVFHLASLSPSIRWAGLCLFCVTINGVQTGVLAGFESFRAVAFVNITKGLTALLLTVPLVWLWSMEGAFAAIGLAGVAAYVVGVSQVAAVSKTHGMPGNRSLDWSNVRVLWKFSLPTVLAGVLVSPVTWLASLWLSRQPHGYSELGLFGAANQWRSAMSLIPAVLSQPLLPLLTSLSNGRNKSFYRLVTYSAALNGGVAAAVGVLVVLALPLISHFYGRSFAGLNGVLIPLVVASVISCAANPIGNALASRDNMWLALILNLIWAASLMGMAAIAIPAAGARGLSYSFLAAYLVHMLTTWYFVLHHRTP